MGSYVRDVILASHYYGTLLPRVPTQSPINVMTDNKVSVEQEIAFHVLFELD